MTGGAPEFGAEADAIGPSARRLVGKALSGIESREGVSILFAVESGSRAWGFPSPDSDYDCRFVYAHPAERYLSLFPMRDVIEIVPEGELDVNGWDVVKATRLLCKGNAVVLEWLASPLVYRAVPGMRERFAALAERIVDRNHVGRHYLHLGEEQMRRHLPDLPTVSLKKIFYALRPAVAIRWLRQHEGAALPPMHLPTLMAGCDLPGDIVAFTRDLIARKAETRELGMAEMPRFVRDFLLSEFSAAHDQFQRGQSTAPEKMAIADAFFRDLLAARV